MLWWWVVVVVVVVSFVLFADLQPSKNSCQELILPHYI